MEAGGVLKLCLEINLRLARPGFFQVRAGPWWCGYGEGRWSGNRKGNSL